MEEKDLTQEFDLDEILNEFHDLPEESPEEVEADQELKALLDLPEAPAVEIPGDTGELPALENKDAVQAPAVTDDVSVDFPDAGNSQRAGPFGEKAVGFHSHSIAGCDGRVAASYDVQVSVEGSVADVSGVSEPSGKAE